MEPLFNWPQGQSTKGGNPCSVVTQKLQIVQVTYDNMEKNGRGLSLLGKSVCTYDKFVSAEFLQSDLGGCSNILALAQLPCLIQGKPVAVMRNITKNLQQ